MQLLQGETMKLNERLAEEIEKGIEVTQALFHTAVNNSERVPEAEFNTNSPKASRQVQMWLTTVGLVCSHKEEYFIVPVSNVMRMS